MNLQRVPAAGGGATVLIRCKQCQSRHYVGRGGSVMFADHDGTPWQDYYCELCAKGLLLRTSQQPQQVAA